MSDSVAPAGWYPDPSGSGALRYWDGVAWTEAFSQPSPAPAPPAPASPTPRQPPHQQARRWLRIAAVVGVLVAAAGAALLAVLSFGVDRAPRAGTAVALAVLLMAAALVFRRGRRTASIATVAVAAAAGGAGTYRLVAYTLCEERVEAGADLSGCDLGGQDLAGLELRGIDLSGANLEGADLRGTQLEDADLRDARLRDADLRSASLRGVDLRGADLDGVRLGDANLVRARLTNASLIRAVATGINAGEADLSGTDLTGAQFAGAQLDSASLSGATLTRTDLTEAALNSADLSDAVLDDVELSGAALYGTILTGAELRDVDLRGSILETADLSGASIVGTVLARAILNDARLVGAAFEDSSLAEASLLGADFTDATMQAVDLTGASLEATIGLSDAALSGALGVDPLDLARTLSDQSLFLEGFGQIATAAEAACAGTPVPGAGTSPSNGWFLVDVGDDLLTSFSWPHTPAALRFVDLVACYGPIQTLDLQVCGPYFFADGSLATPITRYQESVTVRIVDPATAGVLAEQTFDAPPPESCPSNAPASLERIGGDLDPAAVHDGVSAMATSVAGPP